MKKVYLVLASIILLLITSCSNLELVKYGTRGKIYHTTSSLDSSNITDTTTSVISTISNINERESDKMIILIDNYKVDIEWEDNDSVADLYELAKKGIIINMTRSGGFEQYGPIGKSISSNDTTINANYGDIILYSSRYLCLMYGSNTWSYTKVGHINLGQDKLKELLDKPSVVVTLKME